jgi:4-hydroxybenzoate polyprenyltransferase
VKIGRSSALRLSTALHIGSAALILTGSWLLQSAYPDFQWLHWVGAAVFVGLLFYQHTLVRPDDLSKVNIAFFTTNGMASLIFGALVILDIYL